MCTRIKYVDESVKVCFSVCVGVCWMTTHGVGLKCVHVYAVDEGV